MKRPMRSYLGLAVAGTAVLAFVVFGTATYAAPPEDKGGNDKVKTPPVVTELRADPVTDTEAHILWTTDQLADSDIKYGVAPKTNINGPRDLTLVYSHEIILSDLIPETTYAYCITTKNEANRKTVECGTFTTLATGEEPEPPTPRGGGGFTLITRTATLSGYAYPTAAVIVELRPIPFGPVVQRSLAAAKDGSFSVSFEGFPRGLYAFNVVATDAQGRSSARKGVQFDFVQLDSSFAKDRLILPPTISVADDVVAHGSNLFISGSSQPNAPILVDIGGISYETKADADGVYAVPISTVLLAPGKIAIRARTTAISGSGYDWSSSITVTVSGTTIPSADLNADGVVDIKDASIFLARPIDLNGDGRTNAGDLSVFLLAL